VTISVIGNKRKLCQKRVYLNMMMNEYTVDFIVQSVSSKIVPKACVFEYDDE